MCWGVHVLGDQSGLCVRIECPSPPPVSARGLVRKDRGLVRKGGSLEEPRPRPLGGEDDDFGVCSASRLRMRDGEDWVGFLVGGKAAALHQHFPNANPSPSSVDFLSR